jgi:anaerobic magnesium-protoporphyrin IX monomethyl ester cyclase
MAPRGKVVLFFPSYASREASPPLACISIAAPLLGEGYEVRIVDSTLEPDCVTAVLRELEGALCLGISVMTGPMIREAVRVGRAAKATFPQLPVILGGWHPSILPEQTLADPSVDVVCLRQGEITLLELARCFEVGAPIDDVAGILWKDRGELHRNAARHHPKVAELPSRLPGYDLIDFERYHATTGLRWAMYSSSHGCPYDCSYCSNASVYGRNLDVLPIEQVVEEVSHLVRKHGIRLVGVIDDIFFACTERCLQIAEGFIRSGLRFEWYIQDRVDQWARLAPDQARLFRRAGLARVHFGAESGSDKVLRSIEKRAGSDKTVLASERCREAGIRASFGFIFGFPDEEEEDLHATLDLIDRIYGTNPNADCYTNIFTPYPGSPLWPVAVARGFRPPESFEAWSAFYPRVTRLPWLDEDEHRRLQAIRQYLRFGYHQVNVGEKPPPLAAPDGPPLPQADLTLPRSAQELRLAVGSLRILGAAASEAGARRARALLRPLEHRGPTAGGASVGSSGGRLQRDRVEGDRSGPRQQPRRLRQLHSVTGGAVGRARRRRVPVRPGGGGNGRLGLFRSLVGTR